MSIYFTVSEAILLQTIADCEYLIIRAQFSLCWDRLLKAYSAYGRGELTLSTLRKHHRNVRLVLGGYKRRQELDKALNQCPPL